VRAQDDLFSYSILGVTAYKNVLNSLGMIKSVQKTEMHTTLLIGFLDSKSVERFLLPVINLVSPGFIVYQAFLGWLIIIFKNVFCILEIC